MEVYDELERALKEIELLVKDDERHQQIIIKQSEEIERLSNELQVQIEDNTRLNEYIEAQENIIKEVREYMDKHEIEEVYLDCKLYETQAYKDILEILDKGEQIKKK